jgi:hypothetical protein
MPTPTLGTIAGMVQHARTLTQDKTAPYRYQDYEFVNAFNMAVLESQRLRPDFWIVAIPPQIDTSAGLNYNAATDSTPVGVDPQYRMAFVYYMVGQAQLRDEEETQDNRASGFLAMFKSQLVGL